jgi:hypothetical protein
MSDYDVFLSYSNEDCTTVSRLALALEELGLRVWFDQNVLPPGVPWQRELVEGVEKSLATAICIGPSGVGKWQRVEMETAIQKQIEYQHRVIPVILPEVDKDAVKLPVLLKRNTWVVLSDYLEDRATLERLYWGITGKKLDGTPQPKPSHVAVSNLAVDDAISGLCDCLRTDNVTFFIGAGTCHGTTLPPSPSEITRDLLLDLHLIENDYDHLLPPVDVASSYYAARSGSSRLEGKIVDMIGRRSSGVPFPHQRLASLVSLLANRPNPRVRGRVQQLIVTTNLDVMLERALLQQGISFVRLVQHTSTARIEVNQYQNVTRLADGSMRVPTKGGVRKIGQDNWDELDDVIANHNRSVVGDASSDAGSVGILHMLPVRELCGNDPILYKFRGSQDIRGSCALSVDQYMNFTRRLLRENFVPAQLSEILNSSPILLLGYGFFDPDFRLIYQGLLRTALELRQDPVYSVQLPPDQEREDPYRRMELQLWDKVREATLRDLRITTLESSSEQFLQLLIDKLQTQFRAA